MSRPLLLLHRYLGLAVGVLMVMWCVSGVVMMYVGYPELDETGRLRHLAPIQWSGCCKISNQVLPDDRPISEFRLEMMAGRPVMEARAGIESRVIDLITGSAVDRVSERQAAAVASAYAGAGSAAPRLLGVLDYDQWTVSGSFRAARPLYHFELNDDARTQLYVSSITGRAVQITTARERFWNWLGAVPHWLYFAELRSRPKLWDRVIVAAALAGCFLTGTGVYIGVRQLARRPARRWSPYQGLNLWHHMAGLAFGVLALTWVSSGLLSMNPGGLLEGGAAQRERELLSGGPEIRGAQITAALQALAAAQPPGVVSIQMAPLEGRAYFIASTAAGGRRRLNIDAAPKALDDRDLAYVATVLRGGGRDAASLTLMTGEDNYYFGHHREAAPLPVYRIVLADVSATRYYVDPVSGTLLAKIDRSARAYRWLHEGLHRMDFTLWSRGRPQWDVLMLLLLSGVAVLCATGTYLGYRRLLQSATADGK